MSYHNLPANNPESKIGSQEQRTYVSNASAEINTQIDQQLQRIAKTILKSTNTPRYALGIKSILITGGFGKGEGSITLTETGKAICRRDFDIVCIVDRKPSQKTADEIEDQIYKSLGIPNPTSCIFERGQNFVVDIMFLRKNDLIYPDIKFYDLKAASQVLWGEDVRGINPWTNKDVSISSGLRLLFEKVTGLLGTFSLTYMGARELTIEERDGILSECRRTFLDIGAALCILAGKYEARFSQRSRIFPDLYRAKFSKLAQILPELPEKVIEYTNLRLNPGTRYVEEDPIDLWFSARKHVKETLKFYVEKYAGKTFSDWNEFPKLMRVIASEYYKPFLGPLIHNRLHLSNTHILHLAAFLYQGLTNVEYSYVTTSRGEGNPLKAFRKWYVSPSLKYFTSGALLLFSLGRDGSVEKDLLKASQGELDKCIYSDIPSSGNRSWERLRIRFLKARELYRGYHFVK
jgi:hypothetical protein